MKGKLVFTFCFFSLLLFLFPVNAFCNNLPEVDLLEEAAHKANRKTALRALNLAKEYAAKNDWNSVIAQTDFGLLYDDSISDFWYMSAVAKNELGEAKAEILPLVKKALFFGEWVDYNRDGARILYADLLCDTGSFTQVTELLDQQPPLFSSDADFIRTKALYRTGTKESISKAREKIDTARKMYPEDYRFTLLFFKNENPDDDTPAVRKLAENLIKRINIFSDERNEKNTELELYAAVFSRDENKIRRLKSFSARGLEHPLYACAALKEKLMKEEAAFDYFTSFADGSVSYSMLIDFIKLLDSADVKKMMNTYLNSYSGIIFFDSDSDGIDNMYVKYSRGRPETIVYDKNQDGIVDWKIVCDFGVPVHASVTQKNLSVYWNQFPFISQADFLDEHNNSLLNFMLVQETLSWSPVNLLADETIEKTVGLKFYFPEIITDSSVPQIDGFTKAAFRYEIPSKERNNARIVFTLLDGDVQLAKYYENQKLYAQAQFDKGVPSFRTVDSDGDGIFETTEIYGFDKDNKMLIHTREEEKAVMTNLFGLPADSSGFYLHFIQIDSNADTLPDFTEEYLPYNGKNSSWDIDADGLWDIRYVKYPRASDEKGNLEDLTEDYLFYQTAQRNLITVTNINGVPVKITSDTTEYPVEQSEVTGFYWIGKKGTADIAEYGVSKLSRNQVQDGMKIIEFNSEKMFCIRIGENYYGQLIVELPE